MTAYFISGLGADRRIFQNLRLPTEVKIVHLDWIEPIKGESMTSYCERLATRINTQEDFSLIGLSFGGMIATELSTIVHPSKTILISSAGSRRELPWYFRLAGTLHLERFVSPSLMKAPTPFTYWIFGTQTTRERQLLKVILKDTSSGFLKWAIKSILSWERTEKPKCIYHIHGTGDRVLPIRYTKPDAIITQGGHLMVFSMADKISKLLSERLSYS